MEKDNPDTESSKGKSVVKGLSLADFGMDGNPVVADVKNGKMVRLRPLHYDWKYDKKDFNPW